MGVFGFGPRQTPSRQQTVRCIKPNEFKKPMIFDRYLCWQQLKYSGMLETVKVRKAGFAIRYTFKEFVNRYHIIMKELKMPRMNQREMSEALAKQLLLDVEWTIGRRIIFLKDHHGDILEQARDQLLTNAVVVLQRAMKGFLGRKKRRKQECAAVLIQKTWKGYLDRREYLQVLKGVTRLQAIIKSHLLSQKFKRVREEKRRAEQEKERRLEREKQQKEHEAKLRKAQEDAAAQIQKMFSFITDEEETETAETAEQKISIFGRNNEREQRGDYSSSSVSLGASVVDGTSSRSSQFNKSGIMSYSPRMLNGFGRITQSRSSDLALTLTALILGLACQQGSSSEDEETRSRDEHDSETSPRAPEFVSPLRSPPKGPQGSMRWRAEQS